MGLKKLVLHFFDLNISLRTCVSNDICKFLFLAIYSAFDSVMYFSVRFVFLYTVFEHFVLVHVAITHVITSQLCFTFNMLLNL